MPKAKIWNDSDVVSLKQGDCCPYKADIVHCSL